MPTSEDEENEVKSIHKELNDLIKTIKREENLIILGDFNAIVGQRKEKNIVGKYGTWYYKPKRRNITRVLCTK
jgi:hypothetical protein